MDSYVMAPITSYPIATKRVLPFYPIMGREVGSIVQLVEPK